MDRGDYDDHFEFHDDIYDTFQNWDDPIASSGPCPWGGLGNYQPTDEQCDWECPFREACIKMKKKSKEASE